MKFRKDRKEPVGVNLTPLIEVVFLLLIFFMVSTSFTRENRMNISLPEADGQAAVSDNEGITLQVNQGGVYAVDGKLLAASTIETLTEGLRIQADGDFDQNLVIVADAEATHQSVITAMDVAGKLGFVNLRIATQEPAEAPR